MKQIKFRHLVAPFSTTFKMAAPGGKIKFVFHRSKHTWPALSHAKKFAYRYPSGELQGFALP